MLEKFRKSQFVVKKSKNLSKLGFDFSKPIEDEYRKLCDLLSREYLLLGGSMISIMKSHEIASSKTLHLLFKLCGIETRSLSDAALMSFEEGRSSISTTRKSSYRNGWHVAWDGESFYLRSSYEFAFAEELDKKREKYVVEPFRVKYFSEKENRFKIAVPDFLLVNRNRIVELKNRFNFDHEDQVCRKREFVRLGFSYEVLIDGAPSGI